MKKCSMCGEVKPLSDFYKHKTNRNGLDYRCKKCVLSYNKERKRKERNKRHLAELNNSEEICGGYKIYILNHVKHGECKYNIVSTKGNVWNYNSKEMFLDKLDELLNVA